MEPIDLDEWRTSLSNRGRWGPSDRLGTLNYVTASQRVAAARSVTLGLTVSCSRPIDAAAETDDASPVTHVMVQTLSPDAASDYFALAPHGYGVSHLDALGHFSHDGWGYNGAPRVGSGMKPTSELGVDAAREGIFTRGVLLDVPRLRGVPHLEPGEGVAPDELDRAAAATDLTLQAGDAVLVRTGRWARRATAGRWDVASAMAGLEPDCLPWLHERELAILGSDGVNDVLPSRVAGVRFPIHEVGLVSLGLHLLDNLDLEGLAATCERVGRWQFLFTLAPLVIVHGTSSPVNPIAVF